MSPFPLRFLDVTRLRLVFSWAMLLLSPLSVRANWIGATSGATNDAAHDYNNPANWSTGVIDDSFAGVVFTADTTLYLTADHTTVAGINFGFTNIGSPIVLTLESNGVAHTLALSGDLVADPLTNNSIRIGSSVAGNEVNVDLGGAVRTIENSNYAMATMYNAVANGGIVKTGAGVLNLYADNSYTGGTTIAAGSIVIGSGNTGSVIGPIVLNGGAVVFGQSGVSTVTNAVSGSGEVSFDNGTFTLAAPLTHTGLTSLSAHLILAGDNLLSAASEIHCFVSTIDLNGHDQTIGGLFSESMGDVITNSASGSTVTLTIIQNANANFNGVIQDGAGVVGVVKAGARDITMPFSSTYSGPTTINGGTWVVNSMNVLPRTTALTVAAGGTFFSVFGYDETVGSLAGAGSVNVASGGRIVTGGNNGSTTFSGTISGGGGFTKTGSGAMVLAGTNTYTGLTTVSAGTLRVDGSLAAGSAVTVANGATLAGNGTIADSVTLAAGGTIAPGNGIGTLTVGGNVTWNGSATPLAFELGASNASDKVAIAGALTKAGSGPYAFDFQGATNTGTFTLLTFASTNFVASDFSAVNLGGGLQGTFAIVGGTALTFTIGTSAPPTGTTANVTLGHLIATYDGAAKTATVTTSPAGLATNVVYTAITGSTNSSGLPLTAGTYTVSATVNDTTYTGSATGTLTIAKATPVVTWAAPAAIDYGTALSATQLNASANTAGTFAYSPAAGTKPAVGTQALTATFTSADTTNYNSPVTATVYLTVNKTPQTLTLPTIPAQLTTASPVSVQASTSSGLPLTYTLLSGPATLNGTTATLTGTPGVVAVQVSQAGDATTAAVTGTITFSVVAPTVIANASARATVTAGQPLVVGLVIGGAGAKPLVVRAVGPGLATFGVSNVLATPVLKVSDQGGNVVLTNSGWGGSGTLAAAMSAVGAFPLAPTSADAAATTSLPPGVYYLSVTGANRSAGATLAEVYDASSNVLLASQHIINLSVRGTVASGGPLILGFVIEGSVPKTLLVRGVGPALATFGIASPVAAPQLALYDSRGTLIAQNAGWGTPTTVNGSGITPASATAIAAAAGKAGAFGLATGSADAAALVTLPAGAYTAVVNGATTGTAPALVEIYDVP